MTIEPITKEVFDAGHGQYRRRSRRPEWNAVRALEPGTGVRFPCSWKHVRGCSGLVSLTYIRQHYNMTVRGYCLNGFVSVWREA